MANYSRLLVAHDGSPLADATLTHAVAVAHAGGGSIVVLRVSQAAEGSASDLRPSDWDALVERGGEDSGEAYPPLSEAVEALRGLGAARVGSFLAYGEPGETIVEVAAALGCDLVIIASHGLSGVKRAVLGSVSDYVVRNSPVPVLLCHAEADPVA
jgi:nucleotide-binding universal stress UspA family protein